MKIGLYFGSFNPIHSGHLVIAGYMAEFSDLKQVWMVVSPHNPLKPAGTLLQDYHRFHLVELGIGSNKKLKASKIEFELARPSYTVVTLAYLQDKYPKHEFSLIMGADNLENLHKWKNFELILEHHDIYVYPRPNHDGGNLKDHPRVNGAITNSCSRALRGARLRYPNGSPGCTGSGGFLEERARAI